MIHPLLFNTFPLLALFFLLTLAVCEASAGLAFLIFTARQSGRTLFPSNLKLRKLEAFKVSNYSK